MEDKKKIVIDLRNSLYAHAFTNEQQLHQDDMEKAMGLIQSQLGVEDVKEDTDVFLDHRYHTIGVFGDRGSGKTSFLISLLNKCKKDLKDVVVLRMIDPTLVEHKKPIVLCVISMIQQKVEDVLKKEECEGTGESYHKRREWDKLMKNISKGIMAIDKVGKDFDDRIWQDEEYVMHTGLAKIKDSNDFEENLRKMIAEALNILGKKAFIIAFDDIDVDAEQGWNVLESLRRYLSDAHIISIVSGNIKLYGTIVRQELGGNLKMPEGRAREMMANEMENQYMLKLLSPYNRINLQSLAHLVQNDKTQVTVKVKDGVGELELMCQYKDLLKNMGIVDTSSANTFIDFLLSMSLRSQIHFMKDAHDEKEKPPIDVFSSRLYASGIDIEALDANAQMMNITLLNYLNSKALLPDCYLLMPTLQDKDANSNFTALTFMECWHLRKNPYLAFDYMLRLGFVRNVVLPLEERGMVQNLCNYAGWYQLMSLKNNVALSMVYVSGRNIGGLNESIRLYAMEEKAKKDEGNRMNALDHVLKTAKDTAGSLMGMFPFVRIINNKNNESRSYYSVIVLLSVVGDVLKCADEEEMQSRLNDLKLFRSYQMPQDEDFRGEEENISEDSYGVETKPDDIKRLAGLMWQWKNAYKDCMLPPYALGRVMTRLYTSLPNVKEKSVGDKKNVIVAKSVGDMMNVMVANLFNACLIEETRIRIPAAEQSEINNNNLRTDTKLFKDNLGKDAIVNQLPFTKWMMSCPMLNSFLDDETYEKVMAFVTEDCKIDRKTFPVYELLCKMKSKDGGAEKNDERPPFSGAKDGWKGTAEWLYANGINDDMIQEHIIDADTDDAIAYIAATGLFVKNATKKSVESFKENFRRKGPAEGVEPAPPQEENPAEDIE